MAFLIRPPTSEDQQIVLDLMILCDVTEYGVPDTDMADLTSAWQQADLERDAWVAYNDGLLVGYALVQPSGRRTRFQIYCDPEWPDDSVVEQLLDHCEARASTVVKENVEISGNVSVYVPHVNHRLGRVLTGAGFAPTDYVFNMLIHLDELAAPAWPEGMTVQSAVGIDDRAIFNVVDTAFDWEARAVRPTFEAWQKHLMERHNYDRDLWFIALAGDELIGVCLCYHYEIEGWVRQLGVLPEWRKKGVGSALLAHAFAEFKQRRLTQVGLAVDGDNPDAYRFYEGVGMYRLRQYDHYQKQLADGR